MVFLCKDRFLDGSYRKSKPKKNDPCKILNKINDNTYIVDFRDDMSISNLELSFMEVVKTATGLPKLKSQSDILSITESSGQLRKIMTFDLEQVMRYMTNKVFLLIYFH